MVPCPCCGQPTARVKAPLFADLDTNEIVGPGGQRVKCSPMLVEMAGFLFAKYPHPVRKDRVMFTLYGDPLEPRSWNILGVYASRLRKVLRPMGYDVMTSRSRYNGDPGATTLQIVPYPER